MTWLRMSLLRRIFRRECEHDFEVWEFIWLDDDTLLSMEGCSKPRCEVWKFTNISTPLGENE